MLFNSTKTILLALFSAPLVLGWDPPPSSYSPGNVNHPSVPQLVHVLDGHTPQPGLGFVKSPKSIWVPIVPPIPDAHPPPTGSSHHIYPGLRTAQVFDPEPHLRKPGYTIVQDEDANWNHYEPGKVPKDIVSQGTLDEVKKH